MNTQKNQSGNQSAKKQNPEFGSLDDIGNRKEPSKYGDGNEQAKKTQGPSQSSGGGKQGKQYNIDTEREMNEGTDQKYHRQGYGKEGRQGQPGFQQGNEDQQFHSDPNRESSDGDSSATKKMRQDQDDASEGNIKHRFNPGDLQEEADDKEFGPNRTMGKQNTMQGSKRNDSNVGND